LKIKQSADILFFLVSSQCYCTEVIKIKSLNNQAATIRAINIAVT